MVDPQILAAIYMKKKGLAI